MEEVQPTGLAGGPRAGGQVNCSLIYDTNVHKREPIGHVSRYSAAILSARRTCRRLRRNALALESRVEETASTRVKCRSDCLFPCRAANQAS